MSATIFEQASGGVLQIPDMEWEHVARERAERLIRVADFAGAAAVAHVVDVEEGIGPETSYETPRSTNLLDMLRSASEGVVESLKGVESNVRTDVVERSIKSGHITDVELQVDGRGRIMQYGQSMEDVYSNGLRFASAQPQMRKRSEAETRNGMRIEECLKAGLLESYDVVVISRSADDMPLDEMARCGFFTDTMSCSFQVSGIRDGILTQESAFVSGIAAPGAARHDGVAVEHMLKGLGIDVSGRSATELLDMPLLVPKQIMPDGVVNLVERYDQAQGGTFFGEYKQGRCALRGHDEYLEYRQFCRTREESLEPLVRSVVDELVESAPRLSSPVEASERLASLSGQHLVVRATADTSIDVRVFGSEAAQHILKARRMLDRGDMDQYRLALDDARRTEKSSSCASGGSAESGDDEGREGSIEASRRAAELAESKAERRGWKLKQGLCKVPNCPTRPAKTKVGPCGVCMTRCQVMFDAGKDPTK